MKKLYILLLPGIIIVHLVFLIGLRFTAWPEMLSYPYLLNNGFKLYTDFVHPYPPLLTLTLSVVYKIFGYNLLVLKVFTWIIILVGDILLFKIVKKITGREALALCATAAYVFTQPFLEGNQLWFDLAIVIPLLSGIYFLLKAENYRNFIIAGVFFGLAALVKQTTGLFLIVGTSYLILTSRKNKIMRLLMFLSGPFILVLGLLIYLISNNSLMEFLNWNLIYPFTFWSQFPGYVEMSITNGQMVILGILLFPLFVLVAKNYKNLIQDKVFWLLGVFTAISFILVYPRFSFFHFQVALAMILITTVYLFSKYKLSPVILASVIMLSLFVISLSGINKNWGLPARFWDNETLDFAWKLSDQVRGKSVYLLGQPSSLYAFTKTLPPKPWLDNYGWYFEVNGVENNTLSRWSENKPEFVVVNDPGKGNWYDLGVYQPKQVINWIEKGYEKKVELSKGVWLWEIK